MQINANGPTGPTDWQSVDWPKAYRQVRNLRQRIFRASQAGEWKTVHSLQKLMLRSYANRLLAVRRVTQDNHGKATAGVDRVLVKTPTARGRLVDDLGEYQPWTAQPVRRVSIPKANGTRRPLGIPTIRDRTLQAMVKNALEPSWEARFEGSSYGFRPGRGCHDAIEKIYGLARPNKRKKWVVDADITSAFDHLDHDFLLQILGPIPGRELIKHWLTAGYLQDGCIHPTPEGAPQGGVISPLLLNIALHGMEAELGVSHDKRGQIRSTRAVVRYADDFVVFCETRTDAEAVITQLAAWLAERGLTLSTEKTRIVHLTEGFDFLGFTIRQYPAPKSSRSGYKLLITPSKASVQAMHRTLRAAWQTVQGSGVEAALAKLNPIVRGEASYYRPSCASAVFGQLDTWMFHRAVHYVKRTHPHMPRSWRQRYWGRFNPARQDHWVFGNPRSGRYLLKFGWFTIQRHVLVRGTASPDDPALRSYWARRQRRSVRTLWPSQQRIAGQQGYRCPVCAQSLMNGEELHVHHRVPRRDGGTDRYANLALCHLYCHQQLHRHDAV